MDKKRRLRRRKLPLSLNLKPSFIDSSLKNQFNLEEARKEIRQKSKNFMNTSKPLSFHIKKAPRSRSSANSLSEKVLMLQSKGGVCEMKEVIQTSSKLTSTPQIKSKSSLMHRFKSPKEFHISYFNFEALPKRDKPIDYANYISYINHATRTVFK